MEKLNVAIVDDNPLILNTLDELINAEDGLSVIGKADNGADAINMIVDTTPDIVLLDLVMPKIDGISVVEKVKSEHTFLKNPAFIILSAVGGEQMTEDAFKAGAVLPGALLYRSGPHSYPSHPLPSTGSVPEGCFHSYHRPAQ